MDTRIAKLLQSHNIDDKRIGLEIEGEIKRLITSGDDYMIMQGFERLYTYIGGEEVIKDYSDFFTIISTILELSGSKPIVDGQTLDWFRWWTNKKINLDG